HGLPDKIVSERISLFVSSFWTSLSASQSYKQQANKLFLKTPSFNIGDSVWLDAHKIRTTRPTLILLERKLGPFKIKSVVPNHAFKLSLPLKWKAIHPVFHVSLLEPAKGLYPGKTHPPPEPVNVQDHLEWEVSCILDHARLRKGKLQYLVEWAGHQSDKDQTSWEPANHLRNSQLGSKLSFLLPSQTLLTLIHAFKFL
ncbi:uncharacterized protein VP01_5633g1, partial [Puccinia sorghi]